MESRIEKFFEEEKTLTFCTSGDNLPHCVSCYYAWLPDTQTLIFKSSGNTHHVQQALQNDNVAGTVLPAHQVAGNVKGIQFTGRFFAPEGAMFDKAKNKYYRKFPVALAISGELWGIEVLTVKMIDSTLGFGKKLTWEREDAELAEVV